MEPTKLINKQTIFIDLDGTLIDTLTGRIFQSGIWDMKFKWNVIQKISELHPDNVFIVSNQGGISLGYINKESFIVKLNYIIRCLQDYMPKVNIDATFCSSNNKDDIRRKPNTEMLYEMLRKHQFGNNFDKNSMLMIGDASGLPGQFSDSDKKTAENFGIDYMDVNEFVKL